MIFKNIYNHNFIDITGQTLHGITVKEFVGTDSSGGAKWKVICRCGKEYITGGTALRKGGTSCGCRHRHPYKKNYHPEEVKRQVDFIRSKIAPNQSTRIKIPNPI